MMKRNGFTIVELLMVIGIIAVLASIVTTAAASSIKSSRKQRANALCQLVQTGIITYHAQEGEWPHSVLNRAEPRDNMEGDDDKTDPDKIVLKGQEVADCIRKVVQLSRPRVNRPVMDVSGLFVSREEGRYGQVCHGLDFMSAIRGTRESSAKMTSDKMHFGYPESGHGYFRHFKIVYSIPADTVTVSEMDSDKKKAEFYE